MGKSQKLNIERWIKSELQMHTLEREWERSVKACTTYLGNESENTYRINTHQLQNSVYLWVRRKGGKSNSEGLQRWRHYLLTSCKGGVSMSAVDPVPQGERSWEWSMRSWPLLSDPQYPKRGEHQHWCRPRYGLSCTETYGDHANGEIVIASNWGSYTYFPYFLSFLWYGFLVLINHKKYKKPIPSKNGKCLSVSKDLVFHPSRFSPWNDP